MRWKVGGVCSSRGDRRRVALAPRLAVEAPGLLIECILVDDRYEVRSGTDGAWNTSTTPAGHAQEKLSPHDDADRSVARGVSPRSARHAQLEAPPLPSPK